VRQQIFRRHDHAGNAEAALHRALIEKGFLHGIQAIVGCEPLDRDDRAPVGFDREHETRVHRAAVDQHGAGAAFTLLAARLRAGQTEAIAQRVE
jgi:hypothetical protein